MEVKLVSHLDICHEALRGAHSSCLHEPCATRRSQCWALAQSLMVCFRSICFSAAKAWSSPSICPPKVSHPNARAVPQGGEAGERHLNLDVKTTLASLSWQGQQEPPQRSILPWLSREMGELNGSHRLCGQDGCVQILHGLHHSIWTTCHHLPLAPTCWAPGPACSASPPNEYTTPGVTHPGASFW